MPAASRPAADRVHDVVIVGARCAGSATARLLASAATTSSSWTVPSPERHPVHPRHRPWRGRAALPLGTPRRRAGSGGPAIRAVTFGIEGPRVTREVKDRAGVDLLVAPRRMVLDTILADAAIASGATVRTSTAVTDVIRDDTGRVAGVRPAPRRPRPHPVRAATSWPRTGCVRRWLHDSVPRPDRRSRPTSRSTTPTSTRCPGAASSSTSRPAPSPACSPRTTGRPASGCPAHPLSGGRPPSGRRRTEAWWTRSRRSRPRSGGASGRGRVASRVRGIIAPPELRARRLGPGWALVGDAGYHRDPITGHGITDAFRDAELLAEALDVALSEPALGARARCAPTSGDATTPSPRPSG